MTGNELFEEYCNEYPLIMGYREVSYESWLQRQVIELRENVVNKNCNIPRVSIALENKRKAFCIWYYAQSQPLDANKVFDWFFNEC